MEEKIHQVDKKNISSKRLMAWFFDWSVGGILSSLPAVIVYNQITQKGILFSSLYDLRTVGISETLVLFTGFFCLILGVLYYMVIPWKIYPGQTLGKKIFHLKIKKSNGKAITFMDYVVRQIIFLFLIEGTATVLSRYVSQLITLSSNFYVDSYLTIIWFGLTVLSGMLALGTTSNLAIHDRIVKTMIIHSY